MFETILSHYVLSNQRRPGTIMLPKILLFAASLFVFSQIITGEKDYKRAHVREYVDIGGNTYFIDSYGYHRDEVKSQCESLNMSIVAMDSAQKWQDIETWLFLNDLAWEWFWTSGLRDENSTTWYWESTGAEVAEYFWRPGQPDMNDQLIRTCLNFNADQGGWDDDDCELYLMGTLCE